MASWFERIAATVALLHTRSVYQRFIGAIQHVEAAQQHSLERLLPLVAESEFGRAHGLPRVRTVADLRRAVPLMDYEGFRPYVDAVANGRFTALSSRGRPPRMFATSSGTTNLPKWIPVTAEFERDYRRGWNAFGYKLISDHYQPAMRLILQSSGRYDVGMTPAGIPYGAITGLIAKTQKRIVRRMYVGRPEIAYLPDAQSRQYALMRLGAAQLVGFAITANPATLIQLARVANDHSETLIRDIRDGTIDPALVPDARIRASLMPLVRRNPQRAEQLDDLRRRHGVLRPRDYWELKFLACWTGGSMGHYLGRLAEWWGDIPVRDIGLLASEGRVTLPVEDGTAAGPLDVTSGVFEFIPMEEAESPAPRTLLPRELQDGGRYVVVLSNTSGIVRYRLDDVVVVRGFLHGTPILEFLHRAGRVSSVAGEKLTENQVVAAVAETTRKLGVPGFDFVMAPVWGDPPHYRLSHVGRLPPTFLPELDRALCEQNEEYASRRNSKRLEMLEGRALLHEAFVAMDRRLIAQRRCTPEQYKRPCLMGESGDDDRCLGLKDASAAAPVGGMG